MTERCVLLVCSLVMVVLAGCAARNVPDDFSLKADGKEGIVVLSVSHDLSGLPLAKAIFYVDGGIPSGGSMLVSAHQKVPGMPMLEPSDFSDSHGSIVVLSIPEGTHAIDYWQITNGRGLRIVPSEKPQPLAFQVRAGEVKYLGNLHANLRRGNNVLGVRIVADGYPEIRDRRDRDISVFERKYPQFKGQASVDLLTLGPWISGGETTRYVDPSLPVQALPPAKR